MKKTTRALTEACYGVFGTIFLAAGASVLLVGTGLLPATLRDETLDFSRGDLDTLHLLQEFGSVLVFVGLITFWFLRHYEQSQSFHWSMTAFWALFALAHWFDVRGPVPSADGPLMTTVPFLLFVSLGLLRTVMEKDQSRDKARPETAARADDPRPEHGQVEEPTSRGTAGAQVRGTTESGQADSQVPGEAIARSR